MIVGTGRLARSQGATSPIPRYLSIMRDMSEGECWVDEIVRNGPHEWERLGPFSTRSLLRPDLPCRILAGEKDGQPVLYVAIGTNGTPRYWQWATLDQKTRRPLPREKAMESLRKFVRSVLTVSESTVAGELAN